MAASPLARAPARVSHIDGARTKGGGWVGWGEMVGVIKGVEKAATTALSKGERQSPLAGEQR